MSETPWTKGPWRVNRDGSLVGADGERVVMYGLEASFSMCSPTLKQRANARIAQAGPELYAALQELIANPDLYPCEHNATHRGGSTWTICDDCGASFADDEGGVPAHKEHHSVTRAHAALARVDEGTESKQRPRTFDEAWDELYGTNLRGSGRAMEDAFKEVARKLWDAK